MIDDLASLHAYNRWADGLVFAACRPLSQEDYARELPGGMLSLRSTLVHLAGATDIWARRIGGEVVARRPTEDDLPTLGDAERLMSGALDALDRLLAAQTPETLAATWEYRNFQDETCRLPLWCVFRHVVNHATYHRGQVAVKLKRLGVDPPATDLVFWAIVRTRSGA